jgi:TPR repeat protein
VNSKYKMSLMALCLMLCASLQTVQAFSLPATPASQAAAKLMQIQFKSQQGDVDAQFLLGLMYLSGRHVKQDITLGLDWIGKAAEKGHVRSQQTLADLSFEGKLFPRDLALSERWYLALSQAGDSWAHFRLGFIYSSGGNGVVRDCGKALTQFSAVGDAVALGNVAWILATCPEAKYRDGNRAIELSLQLLKDNQDDPSHLDNLAAAYAEVGKFSLAIKTQEKAIIALKQKPELASSDDFLNRLQKYQNNQAYREIISLEDSLK